jgi:hypothetical protein
MMPLFGLSRRLMEALVRSQLGGAAGHMDFFPPTFALRNGFGLVTYGLTSFLIVGRSVDLDGLKMVVCLLAGWLAGWLAGDGGQAYVRHSVRGRRIHFNRVCSTDPFGGTYTEGCLVSHPTANKGFQNCSSFPSMTELLRVLC